MLGVSLSHLPPDVLRLSLFLNLGLTNWLGQLARKLQGLTCLCFPAVGLQTVLPATFYTVSGAPNCLHPCLASTLPTAPSPSSNVETLETQLRVLHFHQLWPGFQFQDIISVFVIFCFCVCVHMCLYLCAHVFACMWVCRRTYVETRGWLVEASSLLLPYGLWAASEVLFFCFCIFTFSSLMGAMQVGMQSLVLWHVFHLLSSSRLCLACCMPMIVP